ncbi:MAG: LPS export ABC transporter periplasmic protein LptC [Burkholderiaceae bacterium]
MNTRAWDRFAATLSVLLLAVLAAGSYYLAEISRRMTQAPVVDPLRHEPDYFVENVVFTRVDAAGQPAFRLSADRMLHYPDDQSTEYSNPTVISLDPSQPTLRMVSDTGVSSADGIETRLRGNVVLTRDATPQEPMMTVRTDYLVIYSDTEIARTDRPVTIERGTSTLTGVGMEFNNSTRSLTVASRVRGLWQPAPKPR